MNKQDFINAGFTVVGEEQKENILIAFLKEHYPSVIKDGEINIQELKAVAGLPVDEKVNGYGLNFVGRNVARAKYAQKTEKELQLNKEMSKNIDTTQNLVLKGDNLDCLKILKNYYSGKIKCIYIDPPYNTTSDEFVYPDKFDKEEAEVLGLQNLSEDDFARMEFAFSSKKSHNGWLAFMYPRLLLARDLLSNDGVIFISIDDNEVHNLRLMMDEIFGEENFVCKFVRRTRSGGGYGDSDVGIEQDYVLSYSKIRNQFKFRGIIKDEEKIRKYFNKKDEIGFYHLRELKQSDNQAGTREERPYMFFPFIIEENEKITIISEDEFQRIFIGSRFNDDYINYLNEKYNKLIWPLRVDGKFGRWTCGYNKAKELIKNNKLVYENGKIYRKERLEDEREYKVVTTILNDNIYTNTYSTSQIKNVLPNGIFDFPKPTDLIIFLAKISTSVKNSDLILDFFAGSGTTGEAVMRLNAEDGGNRKFILVQIDEPIKEDKPAYKFCVENKLPPVISSITIERLRRAGEKIKKEIEEANSKNGMFEENKKKIPDIGFKVFDTVDAPKLEVDNNGTIQFPNLGNDAINRIYNMIFTVGLDEPSQVPEEVVKDCIYRIGNNYYITNSEKITSEDFANAIKNGKVFIDGWTASLNGTLQAYKEDVKIVF